MAIMGFRPHVCKSLLNYVTTPTLALSAGSNSEFDTQLSQPDMCFLIDD